MTTARRVAALPATPLSVDLFDPADRRLCVPACRRVCPSMLATIEQLMLRLRKASPYRYVAIRRQKSRAPALRKFGWSFFDHCEMRKPYEIRLILIAR
jgi:hypothetical protein